MATWFEITFTGDPTDADRERAADLVREGFTSGQLRGEPDEDSESPKAEFDDAAATWGVLNELERKVLAAIGSTRIVTPQDAGRVAGISRQRAVLCAKQLSTFGLVTVKSHPKLTTYELTGRGAAVLKAGKEAASHG
jgi:hypothetical protein